MADFISLKPQDFLPPLLFPQSLYYIVKVLKFKGLQGIITQKIRIYILQLGLTTRKIVPIDLIFPC